MKQNKLLTGLATVFLISSGVQEIGAEPWDYQVWNDGSYQIDPCCDESHFTVSADYLYWTTNHSLPVGVDTSISSSTVSATNIFIKDTVENSSALRPHQKWSSGGRVALGWSNDSWDIRGIYTGFQNKNDRIFHSQAGKFIIDSYIVDNEDFLSGRSDFNLYYNVADLEYAKQYNPSSNIFIRPFAGVRGVWIHQNANAFFDGAGEIFALTGLTTPIDVDLPLGISTRHRLNGVGPRIGVDTTWGNFWGFNILGNISASLLYSEVKTNYVTQTASALLGTGVVDLTRVTENVGDRYWHLVPNLQVLLGLGYTVDFNCDQNHINLYAAWESTYYWENSSIGLVESGLGLQGLTVGASYTF